MTIAFGESASLSGDTASRPAADATKIGRFYHDTQTGITYRDTGATWEIVGRETVEAHAHVESDVTNLVTHLGLGLTPIAYPNGAHALLSASGQYGTPAVSGGNGGALLVPFNLSAPMLFDTLTLRNVDGANLRTAEWRLYTEARAGSTTLDEIANANGTFSFTPTAESTRSSQIAAPPVTLWPGIIWLCFRNTSTTQIFSIRFQTAGTLAQTAAQTASIAALGSTLNVASGWTPYANLLHFALRGRVLGSSSPF